MHFSSDLGTSRTYLSKYWNVLKLLRRFSKNESQWSRVEGLNLLLRVKILPYCHMLPHRARVPDNVGGQTRISRLSGLFDKAAFRPRFLTPILRALLWWMAWLKQRWERWMLLLSSKYKQTLMKTPRCGKKSATFRKIRETRSICFQCCWCICFSNNEQGKPLDMSKECEHQIAHTDI